jgi:hypothetical protein
LKLSLQLLGLKRGESVPVREVIEKLINKTGKSDSWIFAHVPKYLHEHLSTSAEKDEVEFTWEKKKKKTGGKAQIFIHREIYV